MCSYKDNSEIIYFQIIIPPPSDAVDPEPLGSLETPIHPIQKLTTAQDKIAISYYNFKHWFPLPSAWPACRSALHAPESSDQDPLRGSLSPTSSPKHQLWCKSPMGLTASHSSALLFSAGTLNPTTALLLDLDQQGPTTTTDNIILVHKYCNPHYIP